jgi:hypothetical protein
MPESACKMPVKMLANTHTQTQCENAHHYVLKKHVRMLENARKMPAKMPVYTPT